MWYDFVQNKLTGLYSLKGVFVLTVADAKLVIERKGLPPIEISLPNATIETEYGIDSFYEQGRLTHMEENGRQKITVISYTHPGFWIDGVSDEFGYKFTERKK